MAGAFSCHGRSFFLSWQEFFPVLAGVFSCHSRSFFLSWQEVFPVSCHDGSFFVIITFKQTERIFVITAARIKLLPTG